MQLPNRYCCVSLGNLRVIDDAGRLPIFELIALNAGAVIGLTVLGIFIVRSGNLGKFKLPSPMLVMFDDFRRGLTTLNRNSVVLAAVLTIGIWFFEVLALSQAFKAFGVQLDISHALMIMGAASLSTLVPTAPGYLGTYQLVFVIAMTAFGFSSSAGIVTSTAIQVVLFGSVTIAGLLILEIRWLRRLTRLSTADLAPPDSIIASVSIEREGREIGLVVVVIFAFRPFEEGNGCVSRWCH